MNTPKRILGDLRIFQAVFNDLHPHLKHELVTNSEGKQVYAYIYEGTDPYQLEDNSFPLTVAAIKKAQS